jgi:hypothetical protein
MKTPLNTVRDLEAALRQQFPESVTDVDRRHVEHWGSLDPEFTYSWFESLAHVPNAQMGRSSGQVRYDKIVKFMDEALPHGSSEVANCIDVAFVENLFWQVPSSNAELSWKRVPEPQKALYLAFHRVAPA